MSTNLLYSSDVGIEFETRNKLNAQSTLRHDASTGLCSELMGGGPFHVKQNRKHRSEGRYSSIGDGLESRISIDAKGKIDRLLGEIKNLSDVEKFVLYLKLPTGDTSSEELRRTPTPYSKQANRVEQSLAYTWIKSHLEEDIEICLPKQEVYDEYKQYCENHNLVPLCNADFGKLMKTVFPNVKPRRLGQRGQSRYCYGGLRKKLDVEAPSLPEIDISTAPQDKDEKTEDNHLFGASCDLVLEWAMKLLEQNFSGMRELAEYLVSSLFVNSKSVSAFTVIAAMEETGAQKAPSMFSNTTGGDRHRETQLQLQRKLHERENVTRQKKKLQQMKEDNVTKQRQDRQTPQITSPTTPQDLVSPRKIFEETEDAEMRTHSDRSSIQELGGVRPQRQRSTSSSRRKKTKSVTPQDTHDKGGGTSSGEEMTLQSSKGSGFVKEDQINLDQGIVGRMSIDSELRRNLESDSTVEMMTVEEFVIQTEKSREESWRMQENKMEEMEVTERLPDLKSDRNEKSIPMTSLLSEESIFQLPSDCVGGNSSMLEDKAQDLKIAQVACHPSEGISLSQVNPETVHQSFLINSKQDIGVISSVVKVQLSASPDHHQENPDLKSGSSSAPGVIESISVPISSKPTVSPTASPQLSFLQKEQQPIPKTSVSNRSAFVPFSQVHRKDNPDDDPELFSDPDGNLCLADKAQTILITENGKQFIIMTPRPNMLNLPSNSDPQDSQNQLVPIPVSSNLPSTPVKTSVTPAQAEPQSPTTPKKNRSRFTPIRPKGSPAKTVSSILKEQKYPEKLDSEKIDRSKSVSTLLKEKREREAKMQFSVSTTGVPASAVSVASVGALTAVPASKLPLHSGENPHGDYIIILNPVNPGLGAKVSLTSESVTSVTTTLTTASSHRSTECSSTTLDPGQRRERSRTASLSECEITSPSIVDNLNSSDLSDSSVGDEKPSKLAKIVDSDQNVSSRPGSRCSVDRETPSILGRKRKLFSSQSIEGNSFMERYAQRVSSHDDDTDFTMEDDRRAVSCSLDDKERYSQREVSRAFDDKLKLAEKRNYPDISVLESDALKDVCIPDPSNIIKKGKELCKQKQDTGVGVTSLSLRKSQQKLLEEKPKLDQRMKSFFQLKETVQTEETQDSELPPDVAEFITDSMTQAHLNEQMEVSTCMDPVKSRSLSRQEVVQEICKSLQNIPCNPSVLQPAPSPTLPSFPQRSHSAKNLLLTPVSGTEKIPQEEDPFRMPYRSQSVTDTSRGLLDIQVTAPDKMSTQRSPNVSHKTTKKTAAGEVEFASPQRPIRRQRTPSVEKLKKRESSLDRNMVQRETSVERNLVQTPHSDPGYGSVGPSPILHSVLVSTGTHVCDSTYSSMSSTSFSVCRPDSAHSVTSDGIIPSPMTSPRFQTSTPYHLKSPCVTPNQGPVSSEGLPVQSFMPIQGSSLKIDNSSVTLIRPVVTIASQISQSMPMGQVVTGDVIDEETIQSKAMKQAPPSYSAAMQDMERKSKKGNKHGAFKTLQTPLLNLAGGDHTLSGPPLTETGSSQSYYFSDKLAQLSKKTHASENKKVNEKTIEKDQSIKLILGDLTSPIDLQYPGQGQNKLQSLSQLPNANYQGDQPNVNMFDIEGIVAYKNIDRERSLSSDVLEGTQGEGAKSPGFPDQFTARRNLSEMLGHDLNGDDLQATLDDLKAVDSQYFADNFEFGSEKRQEM